MKKIEPSEIDKKFHADLLQFLSQHLKPDTSDRFLAIASQVVGAIMAQQNQFAMTKEQVFEIVARNIEEGNAMVIANLMNTKGNA